MTNKITRLMMPIMMGKNNRPPEKVTCPIRVTMTKASFGIYSIASIKFSSCRALKQQRRDRIQKKQLPFAKNEEL